MFLVRQLRALLPPKYRQFAKFLIVGGTCWIVDATIYTALTHTVFVRELIMAKVISMVVSTILSYILNREWSFSNRGGRHLRHEATLFFLFNGCGFAINLAPLAITHDLIGINLANGYGAWTVTITNWIMANIVGTFIAMLFRYWSYRRFVFPDEIKAAEAAVASPSDASSVNGADAD